MRDRAPHLRGLVGRTQAAARVVREFIRVGALRFTVNGKKLSPTDVEVREDPRSLQYEIVADGQVLATVSAEDIERIAKGPRAVRNPASKVKLTVSQR